MPTWNRCQTRSVPGNWGSVYFFAWGNSAELLQALGHKTRTASVPGLTVLQRYCASQYTLAHRWVQAGFGHHIHVATQQILSIHQQPSQSQRAGPRCQCHQQIHITALAVVATAHGAKDAHTRDTAPVRESQQFFSVGLNQRVHQTQCIHPVLKTSTSGLKTLPAQVKDAAH